MVRRIVKISAVISTLALAACTHSGNMERNALIGAGLGAGTGAIIGNNTGSGDAGTGALIGGIVGGAGGAYTGYVQDQRYQYRRPQLYFDRRYNRYFYVDPNSGRTYWQNGQYRY